MGGLTGAVHWWEEWQLRVLVLCSLAIQGLLFIFSLMRRSAIPGLLRFMTWLAYLASDAVAIYALATLFNRHKTDEHGGSTLEVVWAPVLLLHLGGHDGFTAYNIEDNELWSRHLVTAVSQVTVAIYVFCKSWPPGGDKRLLQAAVLLFVPGVLKCFVKPWALKRASIYSLVSSSPADVEQNEGEMHSLEDYVKEAKKFVREQNEDGEAQGVMTSSMDNEDRPRRNNEPGGTIIDLSSSYPRRLSVLEDFWGLREDRAYGCVRQGLATAFLLLYTKLKIAGWMDMDLGPDDIDYFCGRCIQLLRVVLPWASIGLFNQSHRGAQNGIDVSITFAILCCTAVLETCSGASVMLTETGEAGEEWPEIVAQYSFTGYFGRNRKHSKKMRVVSLLRCKDFLDQHWCMKSCFSSARISELVLRYLKDGWREKIKDAASYRRFNDHRSSEGLSLSLSLSTSRNRPLLFDESVLLWHIATDFCFFNASFAEHTTCCAFAMVPTTLEHIAELMHNSIIMKGGRGINSPLKNYRTTSSSCREGLTACKAVLCRQMSNYMAYLLFVNPEMLLPGTRRNVFTAAHQELVGMFRGEKPPLQKRELTRNIISKLDSASSQGSTTPESLIQEAWMLAEKLRRLGDENKMWEVIQGVWVEMLCYSASRCRGYLHAKALGKGGEFLSYVWLLLFHMGMETFTDKLQREDLPSHEASGNNAATA